MTTPKTKIKWTPVKQPDGRIEYEASLQREFQEIELVGYYSDSDSESLQKDEIQTERATDPTHGDLDHP